MSLQDNSGQTENSGQWIRFTNVRRMWHNFESRTLLVQHWLDERHPQKNDFLHHRELVEFALSFQGSKTELKAALRSKGVTLNQVIAATPLIHEEFMPSDGTIETLREQAVVCGGGNQHESTNSQDCGFTDEANIMLHHSHYLGRFKNLGSTS